VKQTIVPGREAPSNTKVVLLKFLPCLMLEWIANARFSRSDGMKLAAILRALAGEYAQDLVEYALVVALIACAATAGMKTLATKINTAFSGIGTTLNSYVS
jgi:pilus assembly protein Flp/PilA